MEISENEAIDFDLSPTIIYSTTTSSESKENDPESVSNSSKEEEIIELVDDDPDLKGEIELEEHEGDSPKALDNGTETSVIQNNSNNVTSNGDVNCKLYTTKNKAHEIQQKIFMSVQRWGKSFLIAPDKCLAHLLQSRGYSSDKIPIDSLLNERGIPSKEQIADYDNELVYAIRSSNLATIKRLHSQGRSMMACNKFGESILHLASRRSTPDVVEYLLTNGGNLRLLDDYGRNPLHDACWRSEPDFEVIMMIMDRDLELVRMEDVRGATPLNYIRQEFWMHWSAFLYHQRGKYWPPRGETPIKNESDVKPLFVVGTV
eukprot:CAMPEP_0182420916 /NCGR_PEP_ID=MMETSP1167-20130531/6031_1 /TAXON_ID=2988 /ORGANISM="Mallomonas Sp, Strain CCMP3275" /LENGTH=316 /DNA_ID=CAMNT_0024597493 /DNA_START=125 /DNA_END=1075 /DNA_ORIENTATION=+